MGLGLASFLLEAGVSVELIARRDTVEALGRHGLERSGVFGTGHVAPERLMAATRLEDSQGGPFDYVVVATKSYDSEAAARALAGHRERLGRNARLVLCQNGWGNAEHFVARFPEERVFHARVITGFARPEPHHVRVTVHAEPLRIGSLYRASPAAVAPLCEALARGGLPAETSDDVAADLWAKLLYNGALNPLSALFEVPYGRLAESDHTRELMRQVVEEIFAVMRAAGHATHWPTAEAYLEHFHRVLVPPTAAHESSMLQDLRAGRRCEVDAITGAVVELGERCGVPTPTHRTLLSLLRFLEEARSRAR